MEDARDHIGERLERYLDSPVQRFIDDVLIPIITLGSILTMDFFQPQTALATAPALAAAAGRLAIPVGKLATTLGVAEIYKQLTNFFKKGLGGDKSGTSKERIQSTPQDADRYINGLKEKGALGEKQVSLDGREYYEVTQKINHNGVKFRKGDYISRDTLHHEWEWFRGVKTHRGPINSKTGKVDISKIDDSRVLKTK
jgi:hypothetical protein